MKIDGEIVLYPIDGTSEIEVKFDKETVWLTQSQLVRLFERDVSVISRHINNIFKEGELVKESNLHFLQFANSDKPVAYYSLDVIISVGYRVKSKRGTQFRIWANSILKEYLMYGNVVNRRIENLERKVLEQELKFDRIMQQNLPRQGIFFEGQVFDAYVFVSELIKSAKKSLVVIDNYVDESVLKLLVKRQMGVKTTIYTNQISDIFKQDIRKHNEQYEHIEVKIFKKTHDRFIILDGSSVYHFGASLKDLGKKWFAFSKIDIDATFILNKLE